MRSPRTAVLALTLVFVTALPLTAAETTFIIGYDKSATYQHVIKSPIDKTWFENMITPGFQNFQVCTYMVYVPGAELLRGKEAAAAKTKVKSNVEIVSLETADTLAKFKIKKFKVDTSGKATSGIRCKNTEDLQAVSFAVFLVQLVLSGNRDLNGEFRLGVLARPYTSDAAVARALGIAGPGDLPELEKQARQRIRQLAARSK